MARCGSQQTAAPATHHKRAAWSQGVDDDGESRQDELSLDVLVQVVQAGDYTRGMGERVQAQRLAWHAPSGAPSQTIRSAWHPWKWARTLLIVANAVMSPCS